MNRKYPFDGYNTCDCCGALGAFYVYGDYVCGECLEVQDEAADEEMFDDLYV